MKAAAGRLTRGALRQRWAAFFGHGAPHDRAAALLCGRRPLFTCSAVLQKYPPPPPAVRSSGGSHHYRPFTAEDEAQLASVLTTKPKHVTRHIRQSMLQSRRRIGQFRNAVTYLMILLQSKLQQKAISPADATALLESIMRECVSLRQGDMAHLLFRAAIRFRKYGLQIGYPFVRSLFESYRTDNARELMRNMAEELRNDPTLRFIAVLAYQLSGDPVRAAALWKEIPSDTLQTSDYCALIESLGTTAAYEDAMRLTKELLSQEDALARRGIQMDSILSSAVVSLRGGPGDKEVAALTEMAVARGARLSEAAMATLLRAELSDPRRVACPADAYAVEKGLREKLRVESLGLAAETALIAKCSDMMAHSHEQGDEVMLEKVKHLQAVVEAALEEDRVDDLADPMYILALIKGFGVLGRFEEMRGVFDRVRKAGLVKDHRLYDEMLKWYAYSYNLKEVIALKEEMTQQNIFHTAYTYHNLFRVLDRYYPKVVEKYLAEMRGKGMAIEGFMYPTLLRVFTELQDVHTVEQLYAEIKSKASHGNRSVLTSGAIIQMLKCFQANEERCQALLKDAEEFGLLANQSVQAEVIRLYAEQNRRAELDTFLSRIPCKSVSLYRALLRDAAKRRDRERFSQLLKEVSSDGLPLNERLFSTVVTGLSYFQDHEGVKEYIKRASANDSITRSPFFFAESAAANARVGDPAAAEACWEDLLAANIAITMPVYNRFLELFLTQNNMSRVQQVLDTMMERVPPNPVTATTVVDMLGKMGRLSEMEAVLAEMNMSTNATPTLVTYHQAMNAYAKCGDVAKMEDVRERLKEAGFKENHVTYNILFEGYGRAKRFERLPELQRERTQRGIPMEEFGYVVLLTYYSRARLGAEAEALVEDMVNNGVPFTSRVLSTIATAFSVMGNIPQTEHYVALLLAHPDCRLREVESVYLIYARMRDTVKLQELLDTKSLPKSEFAYNVSVAAFARAGEHNKVAFLLLQMEGLGYSLSRSTSVTLSSLLLKAGKLDLAQTVLRWEADRGHVTDKDREALLALQLAKDPSENDEPEGNLATEDAIQEQLQHEARRLQRRTSADDDIEEDDDQIL